MGDNIVEKNEKDCARGRQEAYHTGRSLGYHLGYSLGFESGFEKGYTEGSTLGYNNGFLAALRLLEDAGAEDPNAMSVPYSKIYQSIQKLIEAGHIRLYLSGCAAREAEMLFKLLNIDVQVITREFTVRHTCR